MSELTLDQLAELAANAEDQTEVTSGGDYEYTPPPAGKTIGRLIEYIELGKQKQRPYQGKPKPDADMVRFTFELLDPKKHKVEYEVDGEKRTRYNTISFNISKKLATKARFKKLFDALDYGRGNKHVAKMLGNAYILTVFHNEVEKDGKKTTYANLWDANGNFGIAAPRINKNAADPTQDEDWVDIPEARLPKAFSPLRMFLYEIPTKATWDSLFIDGTREIKTGDKVEQVSKNWLQEMILSASDFTGSPLDVMLSGLNLSIKEEAPGEELEEIPTDDEQEDAMSALGLN